MSGLESGERLLAAAVQRAQRAWGERLVAAYALGSLAHGGFSAASDVDIGLVLSDPLDRQDAERVRGLSSSIAASRQPFADRLSVFWGSLATLSGASEGGRFPPLDRLDLKQYGRLLAGRDVRDALPAPTREELVIAAAEFALKRLGSDEVIAQLKDPDALTRSNPKTLTKLVLFPVRFLYTARTGEVGRNEAAVNHFAAGPERPASRLALMALAWRDAPPKPSDANAVAALASGLVPLYREFLSDHEPRLREYGRNDLAEAFVNWRLKLA
jgi:predicted nucleotidyltransferase